MVMRALTRLRGVWRSFLRHSGLAEPGEVRGFVQCLDFRHSPICGRPETGDARIAIISAQSPGLGELRIGAPGFAHQSIGGGEKSAGAGMFGIDAACFSSDWTALSLTRWHFANGRGPLHPAILGFSICKRSRR